MKLVFNLQIKRSWALRSTQDWTLLHKRIKVHPFTETYKKGFGIQQLQICSASSFDSKDRRGTVSTTKT